MAEHSRTMSLPVIMDSGQSAADSDDPYEALRSSSPSSRRGGRRKPATAAAAVGRDEDLLAMAHLSFRTLGTAPRMPNSTPSLKEQLRMARMTSNRPLPQVESTRSKKAAKQHAYNLNVKARMNKLLAGTGGAGTNDRNVIQRLRKENKKLTEQLADTQRQLADADTELDALREEVERLRSGGGGDGGDGAAPRKTQGSTSRDDSPGSGNSSSRGGKAGSRPTSPGSRGSTPRAATPPMRMRSNSSGTSHAIGRSSTSANIVRRTSTAGRNFVTRSSTNDFSAFRARSNTRMLRGSLHNHHHGGGNAGGGPVLPSDLIVKFPWNVTSLSLDDKSEDQLLKLQESGVADANVMALLCKIFEIVRLMAVAGEALSDLDTLCRQAQDLLVQLTGCEVVNLWAVNSDGTVLLCRGNKDEPPHAVALTTGCVGHVFQNRTALAINSNLAQQPLYDPSADAYRLAGLASNMLAVPIVGDSQQVIGVLQCLNRPKGTYSDIEESILRQCGLLLGRVVQQSSLHMRKEAQLVASQAIVQVTSRLYSALAAVSIDAEEPDTFDLRKTLESVQTQTEVFVGRLVHEAVQVRVHLAKEYSSVAVADMLATLPPKRLRDSQDIVLNRSGNGIVGAVYHGAKADYTEKALTATVFNENIDIVAEEGYGTFTVPVCIGGHRSPLAVLQISQPHSLSSAQRQLHMDFYTSYANQVAFVLLYFFNTSSLQGQLFQAQSGAPEAGKKK